MAQRSRFGPCSYGAVMLSLKDIESPVWFYVGKCSSTSIRNRLSATGKEEGGSTRHGAGTAGWGPV